LPPEEALFEIGTSSDAIEAIPAATYCFLKYPKQFAHAVSAAVNGGDASDSIAALTGSFVGAASGLASIPKPWREEIENVELLQDVSEMLLGKAVSASQVAANHSLR
jgi:ADP-ribosylglycohydrolase